MKTKTIIAALGLVAAIGCKNQAATQTSSSVSDTSSSTITTSNPTNTTLSPEELGELGAKIKKNPDDAQKLLSEKGLTTQSFEQQVRQVSQDPEASKRYAAAYKKAA